MLFFLNEPMDFLIIGVCNYMSKHIWKYDNFMTMEYAYWNKHLTCLNVTDAFYLVSIMFQIRAKLC